MKLVKKADIIVENESVRKVMKKALPNESVRKISSLSEKEGVWNPIYKIDTSLSRSYVLKILNPSFAPSFKCLSEVNVMKIMKSYSSIPIPEVIDFDETKDLIGYEYILMEFIEGISLEKLLKQNPNLKYHKKLLDIYSKLKGIKICSSSCHTIGGIHDFKKLENGTIELKLSRLSDCATDGPYIDFKEMIVDVINIRIPYIRKTKFSKFAPKFEKFCEYLSNCPISLKTCEPKICHCDLGNFENIIVDEKTNEIVAILDWEWCMINLFDYDLEFLRNLSGRDDGVVKERRDSVWFEGFEEVERIWIEIESFTTCILKGSHWFDDASEFHNFENELLVKMEKVFLEIEKKYKQ